MKLLGAAQTEAEHRAERALAHFSAEISGPFSYRPALPAVASPSYHAVESETFDVAVEGGEPTLFLKLSGAETAALVDDATAYAAAERLFELGFSPKPVAWSLADRALLSERLGEGWRTAKIDDLMTEDSASRLVSMQKTIAAGAPFGRSWSVFSGIDGLWPLLKEAGVSMPGDADWMRAWVDTIRAAIAAAGIDLRPAHGDPQSSNLMIGADGALRLVDFDMAGDMDPYYALGVQMNELYQFESQMLPLLEMHDGSASRQAFARCRLYAAADDFYWALRSLLLELRSPRRGVEFLKYAGWRFLRCRMLLGHPGFEEHVRSV